MILDNVAPRIFTKSAPREITPEELDPNVVDPIDAREIFDLIKTIKDPEHPLTLEELNVVREDQIDVNLEDNIVTVEFTPTISHCSMAPLIGLTILVKMVLCLPMTMKSDVRISPGSHSAELEYNKQLNDKERVAAALENPNLLGVIYSCIRGVPPENEIQYIE